MLANPHNRYRLEAGLALVAALLAGFTAIWRDWIEAVFRVDPDAHSGATEWAIVGILILSAVALGLVARREFRHAHS